MLALLIHGAPGNGRVWGPTEAALAGRVATLPFDRPGYDGATLAGGFATAGEAALRALDTRRVDRAIIVGHSYGGGVAAWIAIHHPERVGALVLVAPACNAASLLPRDRLLATPLLGHIAYGVMLVSARVALSMSRTRRQLARELSVPEEMLVEAEPQLRARDTWRAFMVDMRTMVAELPELEGQLARIDVPTTILIGTADRVAPPPSAYRLAEQIAGASLIEFPGAGHGLPAEHPEQVAEAIVAAAEVTGTGGLSSVG